MVSLWLEKMSVVSVQWSVFGGVKRGFGEEKGIGHCVNFWVAGFVVMNFFLNLYNKRGKVALLYCILYLD